jgi:DnaJ-class molecular chaperone
MTADPYRTLGVREDASQAEIKRAYRMLARRYYPDSASGDEDSFRRVRAAYALISDSERRAAFDRAAAKPRRPRPGPAARPRRGRETGVDVVLGVGGVVGDVVNGLVGGLGRLVNRRRKGS